MSTHTHPGTETETNATDVLVSVEFTLEKWRSICACLISQSVREMISGHPKSAEALVDLAGSIAEQSDPEGWAKANAAVEALAS